MRNLTAVLRPPRINIVQRHHLMPKPPRVPRTPRKPRPTTSTPRTSR